MRKEKYGQKDYLSKMSMSDARLFFRLRTKTYKCKMNQSSEQGNKISLWKCTGCGRIDSQAHIMWCPAYQELREGKSMDSDDNVVEYMRKVLHIRDKLDL